MEDILPFSFAKISKKDLPFFLLFPFSSIQSKHFLRTKRPFVSFISFVFSEKIFRFFCILFFFQKKNLSREKHSLFSFIKLSKKRKLKKKEKEKNEKSEQYEKVIENSITEKKKKQKQQKEK